MTIIIKSKASGRYVRHDATTRNDWTGEREMAREFASVQEAESFVYDVLSAGSHYSTTRGNVNIIANGKIVAPDRTKMGTDGPEGYGW